ncbi:hypothetical protein F5I97DRAFT_2029103 [Phlebopus sp. FC_14]|nr:hypothetical protein F5I97DRAFT_2029103 [Phlebopus sp. FC_14]
MSVCYLFSFLHHVTNIICACIPSRHLFALATTGAPSATSTTHSNTLVITGSDDDDVQRAILLASSKVLGRIMSVTNHGKFLIVAIQDIGASIDQLVAAAQARLQRVTPLEAWDILHNPTYLMPAFLVDIRPAAQHAHSGGIHGSLIIERNVLEWRFDPRSEARLAIADRYDLKIIVYCEEGYASSLAAASLHDIGLLNATDMVGGLEAWKSAGLPGQIKPPSTASENGT